MKLNCIFCEHVVNLNRVLIDYGTVIGWNNVKILQNDFLLKWRRKKNLHFIKNFEVKLHFLVKVNRRQWDEQKDIPC